MDWYYCWHSSVIIVYTTIDETKKMFDVSGYLMILIASGMFLWIVYGVIKSDLVIIGTNATGFALNITLLGMKLRYDKLQNSTIKTSSN